MLFLRLLLCFIFFFLSVDLLLGADAYHWVDENGRSHFGDSFTPGAAAIKLKPKRPNPEQLKAHQQRQRQLQESLRDQATDRRQQEFEQQRIADNRDKQRSKTMALCAKVTSRLESLRAQWEVTRRQGYKAQDKRNYLQKRKSLEGQRAAACK